MDNLIDLIKRGHATPRFRRKLEVFWRFAESLAGLSVCKRASVGCTIVDSRMLSVLAIGYNGPPARIENDRCRDVVGGCGCIHAESNALIKLRHVTAKMVLLTTTFPCEHCAGLIINSSCIFGIVYGVDYRDSTSRSLLDQAGIPYAGFDTLVKESN